MGARQNLALYYKWVIVIVNCRLADTSLLRTPRYYGQELKFPRIGITENNSRYYGHQIFAPMVSVIKSVDCIFAAIRVMFASYILSLSSSVL